MKSSIFFLIFLLSSNSLFAQTEYSKKGEFFFYWGYNRSMFSKTNLHFNGPNYDFTLYDIKAKDRPSKLGIVYINPTTITIPQYNTRLGYFINNNLSISLGIDHMKYVVEAYQPSRISGVITPAASTKYAGSYLNDSIILNTDLLQFEHTDGFNLVTVEVGYLLPITYGNRKLRGYINFGIGGIWVATKTNVQVFNDGLDNDLHVAGYSMAANCGPRLEYKNKLFLLGEIKGGYASLPSVLIKNAAPELGDHNITFLEYYFALGYNFRLQKKNKDKGNK